MQTVKLAQRAGLVKLGHVSLDGTKIKAYASKHSAMSYGRMKQEEERLRREIDVILDLMEKTDRAEAKKYGHRRGDELPAELATRQKRLEAIRRAREELEAEARARAAKEQARRREEAAQQGKSCRSKGDPAKAVPRDRDQRNFTDPESRIMKNADKAFIQAYNAQACVDAETGIIVAADLSNQAADAPLLPAAIEQVEENTGRTPKEVSADAGYYSADNLAYLAARGIEAYIPPGKIKHNEWRELKPPRGRMPQDISLRDLMWRKLRTKHGRERYKLRQTSVEPAFGIIKEVFGLRQFLLRGLEKVRSIWRFTCGVHNLMKLFRAGFRVKLA